MIIKSGLTILLFWILFILSHFFFTKLWLYWYYAWLDIGMHLLGGFLIISTWFYLSKKSSFKEILKKPLFHPLIILLILVIGWEIHQLLSGKPMKSDYVSDTLLDLTLGTISGLITYIWFSSRTIRK